MTRSYILRTPTGNIIMNESAYSTEDSFQEMLANTLEVLSGDEINPLAPRRWLFVEREVPVPDSDLSSGRWSLDHLFLDQDGIPTLVEVKRKTDTRLRREVVGQMLDYAANVVVYWPASTIRDRFDAQCERLGLLADERIAALLETEPEDQDSIASFWDRVDSNLRAGKVRLLFVADRIPTELQRIIEFLNEQMSPAEVLGVEVRQFSDGQGYELLVPSVIGRTATTQARKQSASSTRVQWDEDSYYTNVSEQLGEEVAATTRTIVDNLKEVGMQAQIGGQGKDYGSIVFTLAHGAHIHRPLVIYGGGLVEVRFNYLLEHSPFDKREWRQELLNRLNAIPGIVLAAKLDSRPSFNITPLVNPTHRAEFLAVWQWYVDEIRAERP